MAHHLGLGEAGQADWRPPRDAAESVGNAGRRGQIDAASPGGTLLEDRRLFHVEAAMAGMGRIAVLGHHTTSAS